MELSELEKEYENALQLENDYRENVYKPVMEDLSALCKETEKVRNKIGTYKLNEFKESLGGKEFKDADWSKLDMEWFLYTDIMGRGQEAYRFVDNAIREVKGFWGSGYYHETNQIAISVCINRNYDEADLAEVEQNIRNILPYKKPLEGIYKHSFAVFEYDLSETRSPFLSTNDETIWTVEDNRWGEKYISGTLMQCLRHIRENFWYE